MTDDNSLWASVTNPLILSHAVQKMDRDQAIQMFMWQVLRSGKGIVDSTTFKGKPVNSYASVVEYILATWGGRIVARDYWGSTGAGSTLIISEEFCVECNFFANNNLALEFCTLNPDTFAAMSEYFKNEVTQELSEGTVYTIVNGYGGKPRLEDLGIAGVALEPTNYSPAALAQFNNIFEQLTSPAPRGRLAIIDGPPGTGKTFLIRAVLTQQAKATFILVPPGMTDALTGPNLLPVLVEAHQNVEDHALVLLLEDADDALAPRGGDNMGLVSALLNLSDGILGHMLDIRIVATTNARNQEFDPAVKRPGRLIEQLHVGHLTTEQAHIILQRLLPTPSVASEALAQLTSTPTTTSSRMGFADSGPNTPTGQHLLAEVYEVAHRLLASLPDVTS